MRAGWLSAVVLLAIFAAGCGGNSTAISVAVNGPAGPSTGFPITGFPVLVNGSVQLSALVSGITTTTVYWQVCLPPAIALIPGTQQPTQPTICTAGQGPAQCSIPTVSSPLTGFGTISANGLYVAPSKMPQSNKVEVTATSCVNSTAFGIYDIVIDSGYRVQISPTSATIGTLQSFQFNATVTGPKQSAVTWAVCQTAASGGAPTCGAGNLGTISSSGLYTAPNAPPAASVLVQATVVADTTQTATAGLAIVNAVAPAIAGMDPTVAAAGSVQQDVYLAGSNFLSTEEVVATPPGQPPIVVPSLFLSTNLLRATIPAAQLAQAGTLQLSVQTADGTLSAPVSQSLQVYAVRPALVASSPDSVIQSSGGSGVNVGLTGGFFSIKAPNATTASFNGASVVSTINSSRQMSIAVPGSAIQSPGLYPIVVQNAGISAGQPSLSGLNLAVTPPAGSASIPTSPVAGPISVGKDPTAVAVDYADNTAVVCNTGDGTLTLVNLATFATSTIPVPSLGAGPSTPNGVAVDDLLPDPVALVANSTDQSVSAIDLRTGKVATLGVSIVAGPNPPLPYAIGVNPMTPQPVPGVVPITHRALVAYQNSSEATVLDVSVVAGQPTLSIVTQVSSNPVITFSTGPNPSVAIDPHLNWAVVTPGGSGTIAIVDLGRDAVAGPPTSDVGRVPQLVGSLVISTTIQGIGINPVNHTVLLTDPFLGILQTLNLLNNAVTMVTNPCSSTPCTGAPFNVLGFGAAAANQLENAGVAVKDGSAEVVDLEHAVILQTVTGLGNSPGAQAVAVDPVSNRAIVANSGDGTISILSLGGSLNPMQIVETSPAITFTSSAPLSALTVTGGNFPLDSVVRLDHTALATTPVASTCSATTCRQLTAVVPASLLGSARRFLLDVQDPSTGAASNVTGLMVIQPVAVGSQPAGVAVDTDRDLAVVTNTGDSTVSLVSLAPVGPTSPNSLGPVGALPGPPVSVGAQPQGVAVLPRAGLAVVANNGSNNASVIDVTGQNSPATVTLCGANCTGPVGVAINQDTATAAVTDSNPGSVFNQGYLSVMPVSLATSSANSTISVNQNPLAVAIDPALNYAAVATASNYASVPTSTQPSSTSSVDIVSLASQAKVGTLAGTSLDNPTGIVFDPVNQVFLVVDSQLNDLLILDPNTFLGTPISVGMAPTSVDYNFQASTLVTVNGPSRTISVLAYVCPPASGTPTCVAPGVRTILGLGGSQTALLTLGANAVAIDPKLNLAALVDPDNNRLLLVPLPQ